MSVATRCLEEVKKQDLDIGVYGSPDQGRHGRRFLVQGL